MNVDFYFFFLFELLIDLFNKLIFFFSMICSLVVMTFSGTDIILSVDGEIGSVNIVSLEDSFE